MKHIPIFPRIAKEQVDLAIAQPHLWAEEGEQQRPRIDFSTLTDKERQEEWDRPHGAFMIAFVLPLLDMPLVMRRLVVEAYLTPGFERWSDGSSVVPDSMRYGYIKDWQGVMHDFLFWLHHLNAPDAFGQVWGYFASNNMYRRAWLTEGSYFRSVVWWVGLNVGSWPVWCGWL